MDENQTGSALKAQELTLRDYFKIVLKRKWMVISLFLIIVVTVTIATLQQEPIYRSATTLLIDKEAPTVVNFREKEVLALGDEGFSYREYAQTQYKIIKSLGILEKVFKDLNLKNDPYYAKNNNPYPFIKFEKSVNVVPVLNTRLVKVTVDHNDPVKAALVANKVSEIYRGENLARKLRATEDAVAFLNNEVISFKQRVKDSENALQRYKEANALTDMPTEGFLERKRKLEVEVNDLETKLAELKKKYGEKHPSIRDVQSQLEAIRSKIHEEDDKTLKLHKTLIQFNVLMREVESNKSLLENLLQRSKETNLSQSIKTNNIEVIEYAYPSLSPVKPRVRLNIGLAVVIGLIAGIGMAFLLESLDNTLKSPEDVEHHLQLPFLGFIPSVQRKEAKKAADIDLITFDQPKSTIAEAYRAVRTAVMFATPGAPARIITVSSSNPKEGKTTTASNLAIVMANAGDRVLLIDADMRKPRIHKTFGVDNTHGLSNVLVGSERVDTVVKPTKVPHLSIIPCGPIPPNPSELLHSKKMTDLLGELSGKFDRIIFDAPPISAVTDSVILGAISDGVVLVIQSGKTPREACAYARQKVLDAHGKFLGVILNNVALHKDAYYYYYYYRYNYSYYGEEGKEKRRPHTKSEMQKAVEKKLEKELV